MPGQKQGPLAKRIAVAIVGGIVLIAGLAMTVLPGPAFVVIPVGLAILATEFPWARRWLHKAREWARRTAHTVRDRRKRRDG